MTKRIFAQVVAVILGTAMLFQVGCAGRSSSSRFYVLSSVIDPIAVEKSIPGISNDITISISPVSLPKYLKKSQIVTRTGSNELHLAEYDRWAGKIEEDIGRVIAENLSHILSTDKVLPYPSIDVMSTDYKIKMDISRFDGRLGGDIELIVRWVVFDAEENTVYGVKTSHIIEPAKGSGYADMVAAQSRALAVFSGELADVIKELAGS